MAERIAGTTQYSEAMRKTAEEMLEKGATITKVSEILGITRQTFYEYMKQFPELAYAVRLARAKADDVVEDALFKKAKGYKHKETKVFCFEGQTFEHDVTKFYPPDTEAAKFWLKNRRPEEWKDKTETELSNPDGSMSAKVLIVIPDNERGK